jgi:hypothetical protein
MFKRKTIDLGQALKLLETYSAGSVFRIQLAPGLIVVGVAWNLLWIRRVCVAHPDPHQRAALDHRKGANFCLIQAADTITQRDDFARCGPIKHDWNI